MWPVVEYLPNKLFKTWKPMYTKVTWSCLGRPDFDILGLWLNQRSHHEMQHCTNLSSLYGNKSQEATKVQSSRDSRAIKIQFARRTQKPFSAPSNLTWNFIWDALSHPWIHWISSTCLYYVKHAIFWVWWAKKCAQILQARSIIFLAFLKSEDSV